MMGTLTLVVGPSGAGKDTLMAGARALLAGQWEFAFPPREITRPAEAGGEDHVPVTETQFRDRCLHDRYALWWRAHGLWYGVPRAIDGALAHGRTVVVNASRAVIDEARDTYLDLRVVHVTAPPRVLARRLAARGRESEDEIAARLARAGAYAVTGPGVDILSNDGSIEQALRRFVHLLRARRAAA